jgi:hypothetical protein
MELTDSGSGACPGLLPSLLHGGVDLAAVAPLGGLAPWARNGLIGGLGNGLTSGLSYFLLFNQLTEVGKK